jgi:hypothetical protein
VVVFKETTGSDGLGSNNDSSESRDCDKRAIRTRSIYM